MAYPTAYSAGNYTTIRSGMGSDYLAVFPEPFVIFQFRPSGSASSNDNAQITIGSTVSGSSADVLPGMFVTIGSTSDGRAELFTTPDNVIKSTVRAEVSGGVLKTGFLGYTWTSSDYVTVWADFRPAIFPTLKRINQPFYKFVDRPYQEAKPRVTGIYHDAQFTTSASISYSPTPTATVMATYGTISTHRWDWVDEAGTVTKSAFTTQNPTFTLNVGVHWLIYEPTDTNGQSYRQVICVAVLDSSDYSGSSTLNFASGVSYEYIADDRGGDSQSASISLNSGISTLLPGQFGMLVAYPYFDDGTDGDLQGNPVRMVGFAQLEDAINPDEKIMAVPLEGYPQKFSQMNLNDLPFEYKASPSEWGESVRCSIADATWYIYSEHTLNAPPIDFFTNAELHQSPFIEIDRSDIWSNAAGVMNRGLAVPVISANGTIGYYRDAQLETDATARSGVTVLANFTTADAKGNLQVRPNALPIIQQAKVGTLSYNPYTNTAQVIIALSKNTDAVGVNSQEYDGYLLQWGLTETEQKSQAGRLANNLLDRDSFIMTMEVTLLGGYDNLIAQRDKVVTLTLASDDTNLEEAYSTSQKWVITRLAVDVEDGVQTINATLLYLTGGNDRYFFQSLDYNATLSTEQYDTPYGLGAPFYDNEKDSPYDNYPIISLTSDGSIPGRPPIIETADDEWFNLDLNDSSTYNTTRTMVTGEPVDIIIEGFGIITPATSTVSAIVPATSTAYDSGLNTTVGQPFTIEVLPVDSWSYGTVTTTESPRFTDPTDLDSLDSGWSMPDIGGSINPQTVVYSDYSATLFRSPRGTNSDFQIEKDYDDVQKGIKTIDVTVSFGKVAPSNEFLRLRLYANGVLVYENSATPPSTGSYTLSSDVSGIAGFDRAVIYGRSGTSASLNSMSFTKVDYYRIGYSTSNGFGTASGSFTLPSAPQYGLIYKVGAAGSWAQAGSYLDVASAAASDDLYLAMNDDTAAYADNSGSLNVLTKNNYDRYGDAAAYWDTERGTHTAYSAGQGLLINGTSLSVSRDPSQNSRYFISIMPSTSDNGNPIAFNFVDPDGIYTSNTGTLNIHVRWSRD